MRISETTFSFLEKDCMTTFGSKKGRELFQKTETIYQNLLQEVSDRGSKAVKEHLEQKLLPPVAYYKALQSEGIPQEEALEIVREESRKAANQKREKMKGLARLPFAYLVYRLSVKGYMKKNFPAEGWRTQWVECSGKEIHFDLHSCLYWETVNALGCPELCSIYCENDEIAFSGLLPKIRFERAGTLGCGARCCDFHFINEKSK